MHYAILPIYMPDEAPPVYEEVMYKGHQLLACKTEAGYIVERLYSTDPKDYLNDELIPGAVLEKCCINKVVQ